MRQQSVYLFGLAILLAIIYISSAQNFYSSGGRYGKRTLESPTLQDTKLTRRSSRVWGRGSGEIQQIAPRAQFFLGSRYGKRTISDNDSGEKTVDQLTCQFT
uniref:RYamide n=1 Tax=Laodelphax striatellus TaxID=195883 RepID=A0A345BEF0_LAOST|nr:RYamide [Laodelphax striatellus]